jgi:chromosome segregation ATPase
MKLLLTKHISMSCGRKRLKFLESKEEILAQLGNVEAVLEKANSDSETEQKWLTSLENDLKALRGDFDSILNSCKKLESQLEVLDNQSMQVEAKNHLLLSEVDMKQVDRENFLREKFE